MNAAVPSSIGQMDAQWLTAVLPGDVAEVRAERIAQDTGFSAALYRLHLTGTDVPPTLIAKLPAESEARAAMEMLGGYRRELTFYREVAPSAPLSTPQCLYADSSVDGFVILLEDLGGWENADHLAGLTLDQAGRCLHQLADLHAWSVCSADTAVLQDFPPMDNPLTREVFLPAFAPGWQLYLDKTQQPVPAMVADFAARFAEHAPVALSALSERQMLLHGDIRADNMFFRGEELKLVDFQLTVRGSGIADIAYLVSQGLPSAMRSGRDRELVEEYHHRLWARGVHDYSVEEAWRDYRLATALLVYMPVVALLTWDIAPERSRRLCLTLVDRAVSAIAEIDALEEFQ